MNHLLLCVRIGKMKVAQVLTVVAPHLLWPDIIRDRQSPLYNQDLDDRNSPAAKSITGAKHLIACAQPVVEEIGEGFDSGNALECGMGQYPKIGVEFVQRLSQAHQVFFTVGEKAQEHSYSHALRHGSDHPYEAIDA